MDYDEQSQFGPLTRDAVRLMIHAEISKMEVRWEQRHREYLERFTELERNNNKRFDAQDSKLNKIIGAIILVGGLSPLAVHFLPR